MKTRVKIKEIRVRNVYRLDISKNPRDPEHIASLKEHVKRELVDSLGDSPDATIVSIFIKVLYRSGINLGIQRASGGGTVDIRDSDLRKIILQNNGGSQETRTRS